MPDDRIEARDKILAGFEPAARLLPLGARLDVAALVSIATSLARLTVDTSDIPEATEEWFKRAKLRPTTIDDLMKRARAVVDARYAGGDNWTELKDAIAALAELTGGGELKPTS